MGRLPKLAAPTLSTPKSNKRTQVLVLRNKAQTEVSGLKDPKRQVGETTAVRVLTTFRICTTETILMVFVSHTTQRLLLDSKTFRLNHGPSTVGQWVVVRPRGLSEKQFRVFVKDNSCVFSLLSEETCLYTTRG